MSEINPPLGSTSGRFAASFEKAPLRIIIAVVLRRITDFSEKIVWLNLCNSCTFALLEDVDWVGHSSLPVINPDKLQ